MLQRFNKKIFGFISGTHSECGAVQLKNHFINAHSLAGDISFASLIAAIPCARETSRRIIARFKRLRGK